MVRVRKECHQELIPFQKNSWPGCRHGTNQGLFILFVNIFWDSLTPPSLLIDSLLIEADYLDRHLENPFLPTICLCSLWITTKLEELYTCLIQPHMTIERISRWDFDIKTSHLARIMWYCSFSLLPWQIWQERQKWFACHPIICQGLDQDSPRIHLGFA